jgi:Do/DeqQ family serine protease
MIPRVLTLVALMIGSFLAGVVVMDRTRAASPDVAPAPAAAAPMATPASPFLQVGPAGAAVASAASLADFTVVSARSVSGVVNVSAMQVVRTSNSPFSDDPFFRYFFGDAPEMFGSPSRRESSLGSGVVISPDGYVVTNSHVVGGDVRTVNISLGDRREMQATLVGTDAMTDIALLKVDARGLPVVPWGDSSKLKVGEWVLAIGSPFQLSQTVTLGIVSAVGRANVGFTDYEDFIQTDAAINPGNSGGALVNARGELVGINTGILSRSGGYQGIGFAVPSNLARRVIDDLKQFGEVRRGSIGAIEVSSITTQLARELALGDTRGALIWRMDRASQAYRDGLRPGDVIKTFGGQAVDDASHVLRLVSDARIGSRVRLGIVRDGTPQELTVSIIQGSRQR